MSDNKDYKAFAEWVTNEIFDDMWEHNKDAFAEIACRKLKKLGLVKANGDVWEKVTMTNADKFFEVFGNEEEMPQRQYATKSWWEQEYIAPTRL